MIDKIKDVFRLNNDQASKKDIHERIINSAKFTGTNAYILILAILIASIGLNMNSTAIVIGAMLISPLMNIILSIAYGIADYDLKWFKKSLISFSFQILISILASTIYFYLSPINNFSGELVARTNPTIWDVLIAIFGGFASIIALTRKNTLNNVISGAAISTALMPPLCTVGFCLANHKWLFALSACYLFGINTLFICISCIIGLRFMHIANAKFKVESNKTKIIYTIIVIFAIIPSAFLAYNTVKKYKIEDNFKSFLASEFDFENTQIVQSNISITKKEINIALIGYYLDESTIQTIEKNLVKYELNDYSLNVNQTQIEQGITKNQLDELIKENNQNMTNIGLEKELIEIKKILEVQQKAKEKQNNAIKDILIIYPNIKQAGFVQTYNLNEEAIFTLLLIVDEQLSQDEIEGLNQWLNIKFDKTVKIIQIK